LFLRQGFFGHVKEAQKGSEAEVLIKAVKSILDFSEKQKIPYARKNIGIARCDYCK
jgi:hypothetical protein